MRDVRVRFNELAARRIVAVALLRDGQTDDPDIPFAHRRKQAPRVFGRDEERAERADDAEILAAGASRGDRIQSVLRLQRGARVGGTQARPADRPVRFARGELVVEKDRLMRAMKRADARADDGDAEGG